MLGNRKLVIDTHSEVYQELLPWADDTFWDLQQHTVIPGAIYVFCREQVNRHNQIIQELATKKTVTVVIDNAAEGSQTLVTWACIKGLRNLIEQNKILLISGGDLPLEWSHIVYEHFLPKILDYDENVTELAQWPEIFSQTNKPYKFLFLSGRARPHRKYLLERFSNNGLIESALWTNLDRGLQMIRQDNGASVYDPTGTKKRIEYKVAGQDVIAVPRDIQYLPKKYEVPRYQHRIDLAVPDHETFVDNHLFDQEWGEIYISALPYIDSYFSLVAETVFDYPYSFRTEKIWKPIAMGHPWIVAANADFYKDLQNLGFKTFETILDESFDQIENNQQRIERIAEVVEDLCRQDLDSFVKACYNVCKYNQQHLAEMRQQVRQEFPNRFKQFIQQHL